MNTKITFAKWFETGIGKNPEGIALTDEGYGEYLGGEFWYYAGTSDIMDPQPKLWAYVDSPTENSLSIKDLMDLGDLVEAFLFNVEADEESIYFEKLNLLRNNINQQRKDTYENRPTHKIRTTEND